MRYYIIKIIRQKRYYLADNGEFISLDECWIGSPKIVTFPTFKSATQRLEDFDKREAHIFVQ